MSEIISSADPIGLHHNNHENEKLGGSLHDSTVNQNEKTQNKVKCKMQVSKVRMTKDLLMV